MRMSEDSYSSVGTISCMGALFYLVVQRHLRSACQQGGSGPGEFLEVWGGGVEFQGIAALIFFVNEKLVRVINSTVDSIGNSPRVLKNFGYQLAEFLLQGIAFAFSGLKYGGNDYHDITSLSLCGHCREGLDIIVRLPSPSRRVILL